MNGILYTIGANSSQFAVNEISVDVILIDMAPFKVYINELRIQIHLM